MVIEGRRNQLLSTQKAVRKIAQDLSVCIKSFKSQISSESNLSGNFKQEVVGLVERLETVLSENIQGKDATEVYDIAYKKLYEVPFYQVSPYWVQVYVLACLVWSVVLISPNDRGDDLTNNVSLVEQALNRVDYAIIMSGFVFWPQLIQNFVQIYTHLIRDLANDDNRQLSKQLGFYNDKFVNESATELNALLLPHPKFPVDEIASSCRDQIHRQFELQLHHEKEVRPFKIKGLASDWPATNLWNRPSYILYQSCSGRRLVPVEIGKSYTSKEWGQQIIPMGDFLASFTSGVIDSCEIGPCHGHKEESGNEKEILYLAQFNLFSLIPSLRQDVLVPDWCYMFSEKDVIINTWFGPETTISPAHTDPHNNILVQIVGYKYVRLYPPSYSDRGNESGYYMYPRGKESVSGTSSSREIDMSNTCSVDLGISNEFPDGQVGPESPLQMYPHFPWLKGYLDVILGPGDALFIPCGWWHYVRSCSISFNVSYWF